MKLKDMLLSIAAGLLIAAIILFVIASWASAEQLVGVAMTVIMTLFIVLSLIGKQPQDKKQVETSLIEEFYYPKLGPGQLWETAVSEVEEMGGRIYKNCKVNKIKVN